jgi:hypothetical protein
VPTSNPSTYLEDAFVTVYKPSVAHEEEDKHRSEAEPLIKDELLLDREASSAFFVVTNTNNSGPAPTKEKAYIHHARAFLKQLLLRHKVLKVLQICFAIYVAGWTYFGGLRNPDTGMIVDPLSEERTSIGLILVNGSERPIVAETVFRVVAVYISRISAWFMYPGEYLSSFFRCYKL